MIAYLKGTVLSKQERSIVLEVNGAGYLVFIPRGFLEKINAAESIALHIHTNVREDEISLYGFSNQEEWNFFRMLLTVSGVGPKSALEILNAPIARVKQAIAKKEAAYLTKIPGVGTKTAERIIVDLQGKIKEEVLLDSAEIEAPGLNEDIIRALEALGYKRQHVISGLKKVPKEISGEEAVIKYFLQHI